MTDQGSELVLADYHDVWSEARAYRKALNRSILCSQGEVRGRKHCQLHLELCFSSFFLSMVEHHEEVRAWRSKAPSLIPRRA
jgi:hypothetical protein